MEPGQRQGTALLPCVTSRPLGVSAEEPRCLSQPANPDFAGEKLENPANSEIRSGKFPGSL